MKVKELIEDQDYFGQPITFNLSGKENSKTMIGGVSSLGLNMFMFGYILNLFIGMITFSNDAISLQSHYIDDKKIYLNETGYVPVFSIVRNAFEGVEYNKETQRYINITVFEEKISESSWESITH